MIKVFIRRVILLACILSLYPIIQEVGLIFDIPLIFNPSLEKFEIRPSNIEGCIHDQMNVEVISPLLLVINRQHSEFSLATLRAIDNLFAETMDVELNPTITWWLLDSDSPTIENKLRKYGDGWGGKAFKVGWNNCQIDLSHGNVTYITLIRTSNGEHNAFGTYFHERAHTLGAIHGAYAAKFKIDFDNANVVGPMDAYWWGEMARYAYMHGCHMFTLGSLDQETCTQIEEIWSKN